MTCSSCGQERGLNEGCLVTPPDNESFNLCEQCVSQMIHFLKDEGVEKALEQDVPF